MENIKLIGIMAADKDNLVGLGNDLPWKGDSETKWDMQHFKATTTCHAIIMGFKTYKSMPKPLKNRINVVIDSHNTIDADDTHVVLTDTANLSSLCDDVYYFVDSLESALSFLDKQLPYITVEKHIEDSFDRETVYLIGGAKTVIRAIIEESLNGMVLTTFNKSWFTCSDDPVYLDLSDTNILSREVLESHLNGKIEYLIFGDN